MPADPDASSSVPHLPAPVLCACDLSGERGGRRLFRHLNLQLQPGQVMWLRGRNGRGKTSLLRLLAGLSTPAEGTVTIDGVNVRSAGPAGRKRLQHVGHLNALKDELTVGESLRFFAALQGSGVSSQELGAALDRLGIVRLGPVPVRTLSQGQRRRVALARLALPQPPSVWLLDEPYDALDADGIERLNGLLGAHAVRGGSALLTSHQTPTLREPQLHDFDLDRAAVAPPA